MNAWKPSTLMELQNLYNALARAVAGGACWLCGAGSGRRALCAACVRDLPAATRPPVAGAPVAYLLAACAYAYPVDRIVRAAKFAGDTAAAAALAQALVDKVSDRLLPCDRIVPMPLAALRYLRRGYNPVLVLARALGAATETPVGADVLRRVRGGPPQSRLGAAARRANVSGAFAARGLVPGERVLLVDDVATTGATLSAAAAALVDAGAGRVDAVVLAAAPPPGAIRCRGS